VAYYRFPDVKETRLLSKSRWITEAKIGPDLRKM